jgi:GGDEF domain-containing protein
LSRSQCFWRILARETGRRAEAEEKLEELATTDSLTGLKNRRKFGASARCCRNHSPEGSSMDG